MNQTGTRRLWWGEYSSESYRTIDPMETIAILPVAAIEQHGPHLPVCVDATINRGYLDALAATLPQDVDIRILPLQEIGKSNEHLRFPGTLTLPATALIEIWTEIGLSVARAGIRKLIIVNSHGGNEEVIGIVARELRIRASMLVVKASWARLSKPPGVYSEKESRFGIHGGDAETSLMLHFRPDLVDMNRARDFESIAEEDESIFTHLRPVGPTSYAWLVGDLNPDGALGEAHMASADKGRMTCDCGIRAFLEVLRDVRAAPLRD